MGLQVTTPSSVMTPPGATTKVKAKVMTTTQSNSFYLRKGTSVIKLEALVESTNAGTVALSVGSPTTTNHYVDAYALSTNAVLQQLPLYTANFASLTELTSDTMLTASISALPVSGRVVLLCHYVE